MAKPSTSSTGRSAFRKVEQGMTILIRIVSVEHVDMGGDRGICHPAIYERTVTSDLSCRRRFDWVVWGNAYHELSLDKSASVTVQLPSVPCTVTSFCKL